MTDAQINEFVANTVKDWIKSGMDWETMLAASCGIVGTVCQQGGLPNEAAHVALASILEQRTN